MARTKAEAVELAGRLESMREDMRPDVPNLDGFSTEAADLLALERLFGQLASYAGHKGLAMELRKAGDAEAAVAAERVCERVYRELPSWARW